MADETRDIFDVELSTQNETYRGKKRNRIFLIVSVCVFVAALIVSAALLLNSPENIARILDFGTVLKGVTVDGVDLSEMTEDEARQATADIPDNLLKKAIFTLDVNGQSYRFIADDFGISTDYEDIITQAIAYGHTGTFEERKQAFDTANSQGVGFLVNLTVDETVLNAALYDFKKETDTVPFDASCEFMPWGYLEDGTAYEPDISEMDEAHARGKDYAEPDDLVHIAAENMPNSLRYQYYNTKKYADKMPDGADIARFRYTEGVTGLILDIDQIAGQVLNQVQTGEYSDITVPVEVTESTTTIEDVTKDTQLIASWTSSYNNSHDGYNRNYNVAKLSSMICGVIIQPGETWSINEYVGNRTYAGGWKPAAGISAGAFETQPGGGVCQVSSTTYNAALRAGLEVPVSSRHSIVSDYVPIGLDATISSPRPDLQLMNPYDMPIYVVSYVNGSDKSVTVEIYGSLPVDDQGREIIYDYWSEKTGSIGSPGSVTIEATALPDGTALAVGESVVWVKERGGTYASVYKRVLLASDGSQLSEDLFYKATYRAITGKVYTNPVPIVTETPVPSEGDGTTTEPTIAPTIAPTTSEGT